MYETMNVQAAPMPYAVDLATAAQAVRDLSESGGLANAFQKLMQTALEGEILPSEVSTENPVLTDESEQDGMALLAAMLLGTNQVNPMIVTESTLVSEMGTTEPNATDTLTTTVALQPAMQTEEILPRVATAPPEQKPVLVESLTEPTSAIPIVFDEALSKSEAVALQPETVIPKTEAVASQPEMVIPRTEAVASQPETVTPKSEAVAMQHEKLTPKTEAVASQPETVAPKTEEAILSQIKMTPAEPGRMTAKEETLPNAQQEMLLPEVQALEVQAPEETGLTVIAEEPLKMAEASSKQASLEPTELVTQAQTLGIERNVVEQVERISSSIDSESGDDQEPVEATKPIELAARKESNVDLSETGNQAGAENHADEGSEDEQSEQGITSQTQVKLESTEAFETTAKTEFTVTAASTTATQELPAQTVKERSEPLPAYNQISKEILQTLEAKGPTQFEMSLEPADLGKINISMQLVDSKLVIDITAASAKTQQLLGSQIDQLVTTLGLQNAKVEVVQAGTNAGTSAEATSNQTQAFSAGNHSFSQSGQHSFQSQRQQATPFSQWASAAVKSAQVTTETGSMIHQTVPFARMDYTI